MIEDAPELVLGAALAAWDNHPEWSGPNATVSRPMAECQYADFILMVCRNWGLTIVRMGVLEEIDKDHNG